MNAHILVFMFFMIVFVFETQSIRKALRRIELLLKPKELPLSAKFYQIINGQKVRLEKMKVSGQQVFEVVVEWSDAFDNQAPVESSAVVMSDPSLGELVDGKFKMSGKAGKFKFVANADAKIGEGEVPVMAESEEIEVEPGMAAKGVIKVNLVMEEVPAE